MTPEDRAALREAASKATPGVWTVDPDAENKCEVDVVCDNWWIAGCYDGADSVPSMDNARYIALANPAAVLALLDECERMREAVTSLLAERSGAAQLSNAAMSARAALGDGA